VLAQYRSGVKLHIFAHCVGAIATTMAILEGHIVRSQIDSVALNAIHPWTIASPANQVRTKLGVFVRDWLSDEFFDPIVPSSKEANATRSLSDRLAFSLARMGELRDQYLHTDDERHTLGPGPAMSNAICDRMTFLYGRMWEHRNVEPLHAHWKNLVGRAPGTVQRHLYYILLHGRVANHEGLNSYLLRDKIKNWQGIRTMFMHGEDSEVFNPQSASNSAVRLTRVFSELSGGTDKTPVRLKRIQGYGHMDPILSSTAQDKSYPYIENFFRGNFDRGNEFEKWRLDDLLSDDDRMQDAQRRLAAGPVLRAARIDGENLVVRLWAELPSDNTTTTRELLIHPQPSKMDYIDVPKTGDQYEWVDLTMPVSEYREISVLAKATGGETPMALAGRDERVRPIWLTRLLGQHSDCHFLVGSCRYPGTPLDRLSADQAFDGMLTVLRSQTPVDLLFLIGDQIYADATAGVLDSTVWRDRYTARYQDMMRSPSVRAVLNTVPCHFAIDDHEFADNFAGVVGDLSPGRELQNLKEGGIGEAQFVFARNAASEYMDSGRSTTAFGTSRVPQREEQPTFWYALDDPAEIRCPAFILDTRAERQRAGQSAQARLMSDEQMNALMSWLQAHSSDSRPKFIFMGSPIIPLTSDFKNPDMWMRQDGPAGYPDELARIVGKIAGQRIERVVFVGGDPHLSCVARMTMNTFGARVDSLHIVSSGLYAPLPFANMQPGDVDWNESARISLPGCEIDFTPKLLFPTPDSMVTCVPPHFLRVSATPNDPGPTWTIRIEAYGSAATVLSHATYVL
jgi:cholesterol oxidase